MRSSRRTSQKVSKDRTNLIDLRILDDHNITVVSLIMKAFCVFSVKHGQTNYKNWIPSNHPRHNFPTSNNQHMYILKHLQEVKVIKCEDDKIHTIEARVLEENFSDIDTIQNIRKCKLL